MDTGVTGQESGSLALKILRQKIRDGSFRELLEDWKWISRFSSRYLGRILIHTALGIFSSALTLVCAILGKHLIDCIITTDTAQLLPLAIAMALASLISLGVRSFSSWFSARLGLAMRCHVQQRIFHSLMNSRWLPLRRYSTGELMNRFSADIATVSGCAVGWLSGVVVQGFTVLATLCVVLWYDPVMALIALLSTPALIFASRRLLRRQRNLQLRSRQAADGFTAFESDTFRNLDTLKSFAAEGDMERKLLSWQERYRDVMLEHNDFSIKVQLALTVMGTLVQYLALAYCLWQLWSGKILVGTMVLFLQQRSQLSGALTSLISLIPTALSGSVAAERLRELEDLPQEANITPVRAEGRCSVSIRDAAIAYEDGRRILSNVNFQVDAGEISALVGPSGEGKSTLIRMLLGLLPPDAGEAFLRDEGGSCHSLGADTRNLFAYVPQGNTILAGTIEDNLRLVNPDLTQQQMEQALRDACAWDFVSALPQGLQTHVGEGGKGLSEGQAQRIAIARALVRQAPVMLLDEITSALDYETEQQVLRNIHARGVTCIVATHRPSVLSLCRKGYKAADGTVRLLTEEEKSALLSVL